MVQVVRQRANGVFGHMPMRNVRMSNEDYIRNRIVVEWKQTGVLYCFCRQLTERSQIMTTNAHSLMTLYKGWDDNQISLVRAIAPLSREQLAWRPAPHLRSGGEIASHIIGGRIQWVLSILGAGSTDFASRVAAWRPEDALEENPAVLVRRLWATRRVIAEALTHSVGADLA